MKIEQIIENNTPKRAPRLNDGEFAVAYKVANNGTMSRADIEQRSEEYYDEYQDANDTHQRSVGSLKVAARRMYLTITGEIPEDESWESSWVTPDSITRFVDWAERNDIPAISVEDFSVYVKEKREEEAANKAKKKDRGTATKLMADFYKANKKQIAPYVVNDREQIILQIMDGTSPEDAFKPYLK